MSSLPGGAADKLGNRYEGWWTLYRLADVLLGCASRLRLEPPGSQGVGVEFWVDEPSGRWCEQVKDAPAKGSWTLRRLTTEAVLPSLASHLSAGHHVRLVLSTPATELANLSDRASRRHPRRVPRDPHREPAAGLRIARRDLGRH